MRARPVGPTVRRPSGDAGFTLVELLISIVILGVIAAPLAGVIIGYLKNAGATSDRLSQSHDEQIAAAYFAQDVQAVGIRDYSVAATLDAPLKPSIERNVAAGTGAFPCGPLAAVIRFAWDEFDPATGTSTRVVVAYAQDGAELHRLVCKGAAAPVDIRIAHHVLSAAVTCSTDCAGTPPAVAVPTTVQLVLTIEGFADPVTLTGQRRQT
jgi:prepilin-type N-terminal cleavage/methylation domain-containing protein